MIGLMSFSLVPAPVRYAPRGMVCAIDHLASEAGVAVLRQGGSAVDAALATSAVLAVTCQHACGMGGDLWALVHPGPGEPPVALNASGRAGSGADPGRLRDEGHRWMPAFGHPAAVTVPGCVDGWVALHERFGRLSLDEVLGAAQWYAAHGFPASPGLAASVANVAHLPEAADYLAGGSPPQAGDTIRRPGVARALAAIATGGRDAFYRGEFGEGLLSLGAGEYSEADLARSQADWVDPLVADAWGHHLWTVPPNSQGYLTLASAWIASGLDLPTDPDDPLWAHLLVEASRQAAYDRLDVLHEGADGAALVGPGRLAPRRDAIRPDRAGLIPVPAGAGDTIALCAVDSSLQGVSLVQSNASGWGSGLIVPGVRIFLHNRGQGFSLVPGHLAEYGPGRRPPHTLSPTLVTRPGGELRLVLGTMGGDAQPQILLQLLARLLSSGQAVEEAVAAGRFALGPAQGENGSQAPGAGTLPAPAGTVPAQSGAPATGAAGGGPPAGFDTWAWRGAVSVLVEGQAPPRWAEGLTTRGHAVAMQEPWARGFGHAHAIEVRGGPGAGLVGATDPRPRSGAAAGW